MDDNTVQYQPRTDTLTDWDILEQLPSLIDMDSLSYEEYTVLQNVRIQYKCAGDFSSERHKLNKILAVQKEMGAPISDIEHIQEQITKTTILADKAYKELFDFTAANDDVICKLVEMGRSIISAREYEQSQKLLEEWRKKKYGTPQKPPIVEQPAPQVTPKPTPATVEKHDKTEHPAENESGTSTTKIITSTAIVLFLWFISLTIPIVMLDIIGVGGIIGVIIFSPLIFRSHSLFNKIQLLYYIARPVLYVLAVINTIHGSQDSVAIVFYVITALQAVSILKCVVYDIIVIKSYLANR